LAAAIAIVVVGGIVGAWWYSRSGRPSTPATEIQSQPAPQAVPVAAAPPEPAEPAPKPHASGGEVVRQVLPDVPRSAQNTIRGTIKVVVRVEVDPSGRVTAASLTSSGSSRYFANHALDAARRWEFSAPEVDGQPAASTWLLQFRFRRKSIQATPQRVKG